MTPPPIVVSPQPNTRLDDLTALYEDAKRDAAAAAERLKTITDALKAELADVAPGAPTVDLRSPYLVAPLRLQAKTQWRVDTKALKEKDPETYVQYAKQVTYWELRALPSSGPAS
jgi:hypothetical protein